jgi:hypothetical protein
MAKGKKAEKGGGLGNTLIRARFQGRSRPKDGDQKLVGGWLASPADS